MSTEHVHHTSPPPDPASAIRSSVTTTTVIAGIYDDVAPHLKRPITGTVSRDHYSRVFNDNLSAHGMQSKVIAGLFYQFSTEFLSRMADDPLANPYSVMTDMLNHLNFTPHAKETM